MEQKGQKNISHEDQIKKLRKIVGDIKYGMLSTIESNGSLRSRPMAARQIEEDGSIYFFVYGHSPKCNEITQNHHVNLSFAEPKEQQYVSLSGMGWVVQDETKMKELWDSSFRAWFPKGLDEPDIALLKITIDKAEYWDYPTGAVVRIIDFAKGLATGKPSFSGSHEKIGQPFSGGKTEIHT